MYSSIPGAPGSGRGTQCDELKLIKNLTHLSSGDLLKAEVMSGSHRGVGLYHLMASGEAVPNEIVDDLIVEAMVRVEEGSDVNL